MKQMCLLSGRPTAFVCERVSTTTNTTTTITTTYTLDQAGQNSFLCPRLAPELDTFHPQGGRPMLAQGESPMKNAMESWFANQHAHAPDTHLDTTATLQIIELDSARMQQQQNLRSGGR